MICHAERGGRVYSSSLYFRNAIKIYVISYSRISFVCLLFLLVIIISGQFDVWK